MSEISLLTRRVRASSDIPERHIAIPEKYKELIENHDFLRLEIDNKSAYLKVMSQPGKAEDLDVRAGTLDLKVDSGTWKSGSIYPVSAFRSRAARIVINPPQRYAALGFLCFAIGYTIPLSFDLGTWLDGQGYGYLNFSEGQTSGLLLIGQVMRPLGAFMGFLGAVWMKDAG